MSSVVSVKVRRELKERMLKYRDRVNWPEVIRSFIEEKLRQLEAEDNLAEILEELRKATWRAPKGFAVESVREARDSS